MISTGTTAKTTNGDAAITLLTVDRAIRRIAITNGANAGFFSLDSGQTWGYLPASATTIIEVHCPITGGTIQAKRIPSGTDLADVYAYAT